MMYSFAFHIRPHIAAAYFLYSGYSGDPAYCSFEIEVGDWLMQSPLIQYFPIKLTNSLANMTALLSVNKHVVEFRAVVSNSGPLVLKECQQVRFLEITFACKYRAIHIDLKHLYMMKEILKTWLLVSSRTGVGDHGFRVLHLVFKVGRWYSCFQARVYEISPLQPSNNHRLIGNSFLRVSHPVHFPCDRQQTAVGKSHSIL